MELLNVDFNKREIFLHSDTFSENDGGVDHKMVASFYKSFRVLDGMSSDPILIHMHSIGGNWSDGMAIYDTIKTSNSFVTILVYGQAESMSSIILQAADRRIMMPHAYFMMHYGVSGYIGNYLDVKQGVLFEERAVETMIDIYTDKMVGSKYAQEKLHSNVHDLLREHLCGLLKEGDCYLNSNDAVYFGLADSVLGSNEYPTVDSLK